MPLHWLLTPTKQKQPLGFNWHERAFTPRTLKEQLEAFGRVKVKSERGSYYSVPTGYAIICGQNTNEYIVALDCDGESTYKNIPSLPQTISFSSGRLGRAQYLFKITTETDNLRSRKIQTKAGEKLEFRGAGHASVLPPSIHPLTGKYFWLPRSSPKEIELAVAPDWIVEKMLPQLLPAREAKNVTYSHLHPGRNEISFLLQKIHPSFADDYDWWVKVGMALKNISPDLLPTWEDWSRQSPKYKPGECQYKWNTFKKQGVSIGTLYYLANKRYLV